MRIAIMIFGVVGVAATDLCAEVIPFYNKPAWQAAVNNNYTTIDFTGYPELTFITTQYAGLGVTFPEGNDNIELSNGYLNDGAGLDDGLNNSITMVFASPMNWIAADFPGILQIHLYSGNQLFYSSGGFGGGGFGLFGGIVSTQPFDKAVFTGPGAVHIDDLHFGPPIPAPGALALLGAAALWPRRRHRPWMQAQQLNDSPNRSMLERFKQIGLPA